MFIEHSELKDETFWKISRLVYNRVGIVLGEKKKALVSARVGKRMRQLHLHDYEEYLKLVENDQNGSELTELLNAIATNVTHFFRENRHFEVLKQLMQKWEATGQSRFRIWCAASSTGQEPYSIAMTLQESIRNCNDARILATDIDTQVLNKAYIGDYKYQHVDNIPKPLLNKYFSHDRQTETYTVCNALKSMVKFGRINLSKTPFPLKGPLDVIFCRNVMIYFDNKVRKKLLDECYRLLKPGGYLMVGHSESLSGMLSSFKSVEPAVYIKK